MEKHGTITLFELFSGSGNVSRVAREHFGWSTISLDILPENRPTHCMDIMDWTREDTDQKVLKVAPGKIVVWLSPDCREFSRCKTRVPRDVEKGMRLVRKAWEIVYDIRASGRLLVAIMENPVGYLKEQPFVLHRVARREWTEYELDYCRYRATSFKKPTNVWTYPHLSTLKVKKCRGRCESCSVNPATGQIVHDMQVESSEYDARIRVPTKLAHDVLKAVSTDVSLYY